MLPLFFRCSARGLVLPCVTRGAGRRPGLFFFGYPRGSSQLFLAVATVCLSVPCPCLSVGPCPCLSVCPCLSPSVCLSVPVFLLPAVCGHRVSCWLRCNFIFVVCPFSAGRWFRRRVFASPWPTSVMSTAHLASKGCCHRSFIRCDLCLSWSRAASPPLRPRRRSDVTDADADSASSIHLVVFLFFRELLHEFDTSFDSSGDHVRSRALHCLWQGGLMIQISSCRSSCGCDCFCTPRAASL